MSGELGSRRTSALAGLTLLAVRGVLLWVVVPVATLCWLPASFWLRRRGVHFGQYLGWLDINLVACLERTALRPLFLAPSRGLLCDRCRRSPTASMSCAI